MLDRISAGREGRSHTIIAVGMHRHLLAIHVGGIDQRLDFIVEHLLAEPDADIAVHAARGGNLDDIDATADLLADRAAAALGAVAQVAGIAVGADPVGGAIVWIGVTGSAGNGLAGVQDARPGGPALGNCRAQGERRAAIAIAQVAHGGKARLQRLARVHRGLIRPVGVIGANRGCHALHTGTVGGQVHVAINQAR